MYSDQPGSIYRIFWTIEATQHKFTIILDNYIITTVTLLPHSIDRAPGHLAEGLERMTCNPGDWGCNPPGPSATRVVGG